MNFKNAIMNFSKRLFTAHKGKVKGKEDGLTGTQDERLKYADQIEVQQEKNKKDSQQKCKELNINTTSQNRFSTVNLNTEPERVIKKVRVSKDNNKLVHGNHRRR
jgi:hypothetical protein